MKESLTSVSGTDDVSDLSTKFRHGFVGERHNEVREDRFFLSL